ncbi:spore germination protein [Xylanibacillus composti]|uniref:Spore germination protein n=1 Tax=Xylanibacillus composti TaxID=1572762 RepID=A0A8J4H1T8_9BACL|nr:spore germination protein [Xylanibacillus composti]GIQ69392.1 spore germination protein [Xylanibacillus composti]
MDKGIFDVEQDREIVGMESKMPDDEETLSQEELDLKTSDDIHRRLEDNIRVLEEKAGLNKSFDVIFREMTFAGKRTGLFYYNGFADDLALVEVLKRLSYVKKEELQPHALESFYEELVAHIQVDKVSTMSEVMMKVMAGGSALFVENETEAIVIDAKTFPQRGPDESTTEKVVRGSRDGFIETLLTNVTLVRRRIRDPRLKLEIMKVGKRTQTDVCVSYINDIADLETVKSVKRKIQGANVDGLPLGEKQLEELLMERSWNPFPMVRYSERPDVIASHLLEGHIVVFVDTSPSAMIIPTTMFHLVQHAEEYRQTSFIGTYLRWVRFIGIMASIFLLPFWLLLVLQPELKPAGLGFIGPDKTGQLPIVMQIVLAEIGVDLMRLAAVHTPTPLATAMGLIAAILIGDIAVQTGLFVNEVILYMAAAAIGMFATPSYELGLANRIVRLGLVALVALFHVPGFVVGLTLTLILLAVQRSYNSPYLWPFLPFNGKALLSILFRRPIQEQKRRPSITKPVDSTRRPLH